jgi:glycosyltransferase involved in cell wall biosynthesis
MKLNIEKSVVVITPTIGSPKLLDAFESVEQQTYGNIKHLIVVDGPDYYKKVLDTLGLFGLNRKQQLSVSPENTGRDGFYGHRIYAGYAHLVNADYIFFLDEDNWYKPDHVKTLVETIEEQQLDFAYSLRSIYTTDKQVIIDDNCESLGKYPIWFANDSTRTDKYLVDTSCFGFRRDFLIQVSHLWHSGWGGDRRFFHAIQNHTKHNMTGYHTLCYRLDGNDGSVTKEFFEEGNAAQLAYYGSEGKFPWLKA